MLRVQHNGLTTVALDDLAHQRLGEPLTTSICPNNNPTDDPSRVSMTGGGVNKHTQISSSSGVIGDEEVLRRGLLVAVIQLFFIDSLFDKENVGSQFEK